MTAHASATTGAAASIAKCLAYFEKRQVQPVELCSATFQEQGYPIGSGIVERGNKLVVEVRLKEAGSAPEHVDPMVAPHLIACADRWDEA